MIALEEFKKKLKNMYALKVNQNDYAIKATEMYMVAGRKIRKAEEHKDEEEISKLIKELDQEWNNFLSEEEKRSLVELN